VNSQGSAHARFTRAIQQLNLWAAESSLRELNQPSLEDALAYLDLLTELKPEKLERAAVRWHGRLETEATFLSLAESQPRRDCQNGPRRLILRSLDRSNATESWADQWCPDFHASAQPIPRRCTLACTRRRTG
jgi:hypothetical protein